ncbi:hypothetical protein BDP27DRAFT_1256880 [Rhodocollybia butyracea]|uniref:RlpA-like protein double-psi beta-barrel domain-containing protein n=1 Tax=Rhodocollybia butyracea TaxID=206335 RepID=A0A9P5Q835_9AGAR|nr:hypothetical protein BDP27DRAFT_1256880 [Rhodocollybia butyracea]
MPRSIAFLITSLFLIVCVFTDAMASVLRLPPNSPREITSKNFGRAHSLGPAYNFDRRDGWTTLNASSIRVLQGNSSALESRSKKPSNLGNKKNSGKSENAVDTGGLAGKLKAISKVISEVMITWYSGHDLLNPSCWASNVWAPTDDSFVCALTLSGWSTKPKCFDFLELCNGPQRCICVRVVDSCQGCAAGSKHVDLTKAAFSSLAPLTEGLLDKISMRITNAPEPSQWCVSPNL